MQNENDSQTQAEFEDDVRQVLPVGDRPIVAQIICPKTGVRSEPLCGSDRDWETFSFCIKSPYLNN